MPYNTFKTSLALAGFIVLCLAVGATGGAVTSSSVGTWYAALEKPAFNPPDWVFAPVWTTLYVMMAFAAWRVWLRGDEAPATRAALGLWSLQLAAIVATLVLFWRVDRAAGWLLVPPPLDPACRRKLATPYAPRRDL